MAVLILWVYSYYGCTHTMGLLILWVYSYYGHTHTMGVRMLMYVYQLNHYQPLELCNHLCQWH